MPNNYGFKARIRFFVGGFSVGDILDPGAGGLRIEAGFRASLTINTSALPAIIGSPIRLT